MTKRKRAEEPAVEAGVGGVVKATEVVAIAALRPHPRNYRRHPESQVAHIAESIRRHGFYRNVVVARDGTILAGHGVVEAARRAGLVEVPVYRLDVAPESPVALKVLTGDNELGRLAEADERALAEILKDVLRDDEVGLLGTGFDDATLGALVGKGGREVEAPGDFPDLGGEGAVKTDHKCPRCQYEWSGAAK